ncbi:hypothetical protein CBER1_05620 [Cercospora berteroae]|uniref:T6SS Phospholipase effector Tle1-like catalytic domain-containing protein n=1 Tax=Cercospora berteroae TaxID=357750 RepID=A0A2S6CFP2_9PEZI|nr:hypothetical protein CBER1_05620 [Cercospora berteroae]
MAEAGAQGTEHKTNAVKSVVTPAVPDCTLCRRIDGSGTLPKRLIVCCDGTFNASNQGVESNPTNIARLSRCIANVGYAKDGKTKMPQITYYQAGIGTDTTASAYTKARQGGFGAGLNGKVCEAYNFITNNYGPGDELFVFGFSRGAYTARVLASFICNFGLLTPGMMDYFDEIFEAYKKRGYSEHNFEEMAWAQAKATPGELGLELNSPPTTRYDCIKRWTHMHVKIRCVGVFDTVGSVGMPGYQQQPGQDVDWHSTALHPKIEYAFQALALDENRGNFSPTLWYQYDQTEAAGTVLKQCWFPGYHGDVGGHSDAAWCTNSVDSLSFAWMIDQLTAESLLQFSKPQLYYPVLKRVHEGVVNGAATKPPKNTEEASERRIQWSDGVLTQTNKLTYKFSSFVATRRLWYTRTPGHWKMANGADVPVCQLHETIHPSVSHRMRQKELGYQPEGFLKKEWQYRAKANGSGHEWARTVDGKEIAVIPEYELLDIAKQKFEHHNLWSGSLEQYLAPSDILGTEKFDSLKADVIDQGKVLYAAFQLRKE